MTRLIIAMLVLSVAVLSSTVMAQTPQPAIVDFSLDYPTPFTVADAESGVVEGVLQWHVINMQEGNFRLELQRRQLQSWETVQDQLAASGNLSVMLQHPLSFGPPTYRLVVFNDQGTTVDQQIVTADYTPSSDAPQITVFTAGVTSITPDALQQGTARVPVTWEVSNRPATANLVFEQFRPDGTAFSVELPRSVAWLPSSGTGEVAPQWVETDTLVRLRVRLVDMIDGTVLGERNLTLGIGDTAATVPVINEFSATPEAIERGGQVTITWSVSGADVVSVGQIDPNGAFVRPEEELPPVGSRTFTAFEFDFYTSDFFLYAGDETGNGLTQTIAVPVECPYEYFFVNEEVLAGTCPLNEAEQIPAAHQLYEAGEMIWRSDRTEIVVLYSDGTYQRFDDTYEEGEELQYPEELGEPPHEDALPIRGFGKVWSQNASVRAKLGWATGHEIAYTPIVQAVAYGQLGQAFQTEYVTLPNGQVVGLLNDGRWRLIDFE